MLALLGVGIWSPGISPAFPEVLFWHLCLAGWSLCQGFGSCTVQGWMRHPLVSTFLHSTLLPRMAFMVRSGLPFSWALCGLSSAALHGSEGKWQPPSSFPALGHHRDGASSCLKAIKPPSLLQHSAGNATDLGVSPAAGVSSPLQRRLCTLLSGRGMPSNARQGSGPAAWGPWVVCELSLTLHRDGHGCVLPAVREAVPDTERPAAAHGGARWGAELHLQRVQPHLPQPHRAQEAPPLPHRYGTAGGLGDEVAQAGSFLLRESRKAKLP